VRITAAAIAVAIAASVLSFRAVYEPDLGWHLAQGREDFGGRLVRTNLFSASYAEYRQQYTAWLSDTVAYASWRVGGDAALQGLQALVLAATFAVAYAACRVRGTAAASFAIVLLGILVIEPRAIPRPHLVSFAGVAACAWLIERARAAGSARPLLPAIPLVALWSNAHVESVIGPGVVGLFAGAEFVRPSALTRTEAVRALGIAIACAAAVLVNPYGWGILGYLYENASVPQTLGIAELQPAYLPVYRAFFVYLLAAVALLASLPRQLTAWELLACLLFGFLGYRYLRLTPLIFLVTAPMLAARLAAWQARGLDRRALLITAVLGAILTSRMPVAAYVTELRVGGSHPSTMFPPGAIAYAREQGLSGPMFNSHNLGGWLAWNLYPDARVFQDSRLQAYPSDHFRRIVEASRSQAAWDTLVRDVDWAVLSLARPNALSGVGMFPASDWATIYWDEAIEIVARRRGSYAALAASQEYRVLTPDADLFALAQRLSAPDGDRLRAEADRQRVENPRGFTAAAISCVAGNGTACADVERMASADPSRAREIALVRVLRHQRP
jgi:hypothetical protein